MHFRTLYDKGIYLTKQQASLAAESGWKMLEAFPWPNISGFRVLVVYAGPDRIVVYVGRVLSLVSVYK